jgi:hypothetical protein
MLKLVLTRAALSASLAAGVSTFAVAGGMDVTVVPAAPTAPVALIAPSRTFPGIFGIASAIAAPSGSWSVSLNYSTPRGGVAGADGDGDMSANYTLGNPVSGLSVTGGVNLNSLTKSFGDSGNINLSAARLVTVGQKSVTFIGASAGKLAGWGDAANDAETYAGYASYLTAFNTARGEFPVQVTAGYGTNNTLSKDGLGVLRDGIFVGAGIGVSEALSLSVSGTQTQVNLGATLIAPGINGVSITAGVYDAADSVSRQQTSVTVGYSF